MSFDQYFDHNGLLVNMSIQDGDAGDTSQMTGMMRFGQALSDPTNPRTKPKFEQELRMLTYIKNFNEGIEFKQIPQEGIYIRHPLVCYPTWAANPHCFSRDQQRSLLLAMGVLGLKKAILMLLWNHIKRFGFYQNNQEIDGSKKLPDFCAPNHAAEYLRALYMAGCKYLLILWPVLLFTDLFALIGLGINFAYTWRQPDSCDDDNDIMSYLQAKNSMPTPISFLTRKLYKLRPRCIGATNDMNNPASAFARKHRPEVGSPPFYNLYKEQLKNL